MIKFGIVGVGTHARWAVMDAIRHQANGCELIAACDKMGENLKGLPEEGIETFTDIDEMLDRANLDALYVATTASTHYELTMKALRAGLHVICEKPMADSVEKCVEMVEAARQNQRHLSVTFESRYHPEIQKIKEWIDAGYLGKIEAFHVHYFVSSYKTFGTGAARRERLMNLAGSLDCGIHAFDYIRYLVGGEWLEVCARGAWFGENLTHAPHISVLTQLSSGVMVTVTYSYSFAAYIEAKATNQMLIAVGNKGIIDYYTDKNGIHEMRLVSKDKTESFPVEVPGHNLAIGALCSDFADAIEESSARPARLPSGEDGLIAQEVVEKALDQTHKARI